MVKDETMVDKDEPMEVDESPTIAATAVQKGSTITPKKEEEATSKGEDDEEEEEEAADDTSAASGGMRGGGGACTADPNFAVICSFIEKFGVSCGIPCPSIGELQEGFWGKNFLPSLM